MPVPATGDRNIYLIQPKFPPSYWGLDYLVPLTPFKAIFPPLGLLTLAGLTPPDFHVTICDENAGERVDYDTTAQIVGITGYIIRCGRGRASGRWSRRFPGGLSRRMRYTL